MDTAQITQIATAAAALLVPYLGKTLSEVGKGVAREAGERVWEKMEAVYQAIRRKFAADRDEYAEKTLQRLEEQPTNEARQTALADVLAEKAQGDPEFAQELAQLVQGAMQDRAVTQFMTLVFGKARVDKITNIGQAGVVHIE